MEFIERRLKTNIDRNYILPYFDMYRDFIEEDIFVKDDFCLLVDSPYPSIVVRSKSLQDTLLYGANGWELNCYSKYNTQPDTKDKYIPPNNLFGIICHKDIASYALAKTVTDSVIELFDRKHFYRNENNELYIDGKKVLSLDTFQATNDSNQVCSSMLFFLFISDVSSYSDRLQSMARKSSYGSIYNKILTVDGINNIKNSLIDIIKSKGF